MKKILSLLIFTAIAVFANAQTVEFGGEYVDGKLVFTCTNTSGKTIANCNFQLKFTNEAVSIQKNSTGKKYLYDKGDATEDMENFDVKYSDKTGKFTIAIYNGEFIEAGKTVISLPLEASEGAKIDGNVEVTNISFGDPDAKDFEEAYGIEFKNFTISLATAINSIKAEETKSGVIYNLNGQRVSKAVKGVYVIDGKKYTVK